MNEHYDYVIVGSGVYGAIFAYLAKQHGKTCLVLEKRSHIGGNCYTEEIKGITVHKYGPHIFHTSDEEVWEFMNRFLTFNNYIHMPTAYYKEDEVYNLPFNMNTFYAMWKTRTPQAVKAKLEEQREGITNPSNLEEQAISLVGRDIYEKLVKGYTEKQWGKDCKDLPASIIKRLPLRFTYNNNYFKDKYQGIPNEGYTYFFEKLLDGIEVRLNTDFEDNKEYYKSICDKVVYTGSIDRYYDYCFGKLEYRSLKFENSYYVNNNVFGNAVVNFTSKEYPQTRITEHKLFTAMTEDEINANPNSIVTYEYPVEYDGKNDPIYPINTERNDTLYAKYKELADKDDKVIFGGRLGKYKYMDMSPVIKDVLDFWKNY